MRIVIDTNVVASAIFFGGKPAELLKLVLLRRSILALATCEILAEYQATIDYLLKKYNDKKLNFTMAPLFSAMEIIHSSSKIAICRDPDDDKFISCAIDGKCPYIIKWRQGFAGTERISKRSSRHRHKFPPPAHSEREIKSANLCR